MRQNNVSNVILFLLINWRSVQENSWTFTKRPWKSQFFLLHSLGLHGLNRIVINRPTHVLQHDVTQFMTLLVMWQKARLSQSSGAAINIEWCFGQVKVRLLRFSRISSSVLFSHGSTKWLQICISIAPFCSLLTARRAFQHLSHSPIHSHTDGRNIWVGILPKDTSMRDLNQWPSDYWTTHSTSWATATWLKVC